MRCPKCAYVGFEESDRCRHCGYEFALMAPADLALTLPGPPSAVEVASEPPLRAPGRLAPPAPAARALEPDEPLEDFPLASPALFADPQPPPARTPLAVRRTTERPRNRTTPHVTRRPRPELFDPAMADAPDPAAGVDAPVLQLSASAWARVVSALFDTVLLAGIDVVVVYLTAQMAGLPLAEVASLPLVPLSAFVLGLNVAYLAVFTANGGQTLGKMAMGLRVEAIEGSLSFGGAVVRVAVSIAGGLVMGAGFIPALWRHDRRAVHDHVAHTRVVKVTA